MTTPDVVHAFGDDALGDADGTEVAERIRTTQVSASALGEAAIRRAEGGGPGI